MIMVKNKNEELVARLEYYLEELKTSCGDRKDLKHGHINHKTYAQIFQEIEEDEDIRDVLNVNIVLHKDLEYKWQYEIRLIIDECMFIRKNRKEINLYETRLEAQKACAVRLADLIDAQIEKLIELW